MSMFTAVPTSQVEDEMLFSLMSPDDDVITSDVIQDK